MEITDIAELDNYNVASQYLIELGLTTGNGKILRATKTLMDAQQQHSTERRQMFTELEQYLLKWLLLSERVTIQTRLAAGPWPSPIAERLEHKLQTLETTLAKVRALTKGRANDAESDLP